MSVIEIVSLVDEVGDDGFLLLLELELLRSLRPHLSECGLYDVPSLLLVLFSVGTILNNDLLAFFFLCTNHLPESSLVSFAHASVEVIWILLGFSLLISVCNNWLLDQ